jgi:hypothetical protein
VIDCPVLARVVVKDPRAEILERNHSNVNKEPN